MSTTPYSSFTWSMITLDKKIPVELPTGLFSKVQKLFSVDELILDLQDLVFNICFLFTLYL